MSRKLRNSFLFILICSVSVSLLFALIHVGFTINIFSTIIGLTLFLSGVLLHFKNQNVIKTQARLVGITQVEIISENARNISTSGGNYTENVERDSIGRDLINNSVKNITIGNKEVKINPNDLSETFDDLRDILTQSIIQSSDLLEAISGFVQDLTEELRKQPEVKFCFGVDENISIQELVNEIFVNLLNKNYEQVRVINSTTGITNEHVKAINNSNNISYLENFKAHGNNEYKFLYKGYIVELFQNQANLCHYKIIRNDLTILENSQRRSSNIYRAIGRVIDKIEDEIENNWKNR